MLLTQKSERNKENLTGESFFKCIKILRKFLDRSNEIIKTKRVIRVYLIDTIANANITFLLYT